MLLLNCVVLPFVISRKIIARLNHLNKLLLIRDIQETAKTYINDDRSYRWIWKNKIADVYHIGYVTFMNYISVPSINAKIDEAIAKKKR